MTLLEALNRINSAALPGARETAEFYGETQFAEFKPVADDKGRLFVHCGGNVVFGTHRTDGLRGAAYIVVDDSDERSWLWKRAQGAEISGLGGPCPSKCLKVVISL